MPRLSINLSSDHNTGKAGHTNTSVHLASLSSWPSVGLSFPDCKRAVVPTFFRDSKDKGVKTLTQPAVSRPAPGHKPEKNPEFGTHACFSLLALHVMGVESGLRGPLLSWTLPAHLLCPSLEDPHQEQCQPTTVVPAGARWDTGSQGQWERGQGAQARA